MFLCNLSGVFNSWWAYTARVTVLGLCVCVCVSVSYHVFCHCAQQEAVPMCAALHWLDFKNGNFRKNTAFKSYGVKQEWKSHYANELELTTTAFAHLFRSTNQGNHLMDNWWTDRCLRGNYRGKRGESRQALGCSARGDRCTRMRNLKEQNCRIVHFNVRVEDYACFRDIFSLLTQSEDFSQSMLGFWSTHRITYSARPFILLATYTDIKSSIQRCMCTACLIVRKPDTDSEWNPADVYVTPAAAFTR